MLPLKPIQWIARTLTADSAPHQLALAFALGAWIGLVPKGNLTAGALMILLFALRMNLGVGMLTAFVFSWVGMLLDPISHELGHWLLTCQALQPLWTDLYNLPIVPWTSFNNTVVLGSFAIGLMLLGPFYFGSKPVFQRYVSRWVDRLHQYRLIKLIWGLKVATNIAS